MDDSKWERWGALGGILFVIMVLVSVFLPGSPPKTSDSAAKIVKFFADNGDEIRWAAYIAVSGHHPAVLVAVVGVAAHAARRRRVAAADRDRVGRRGVRRR